METYFGEIEHMHSHLARDRVLTDLKTLTRDSEDMLKATAHDASEAAKGARARVTSTLERAKATIKELQEQAVVTAHVAARRANTAVRAHPYQSIGTAFCLGFLLGVVVARMNRPAQSESKQG